MTRERAAAWWLVVLLTLLYATSYVDRFILALLIEPITTDLGISDSQMGLLVGGAFSVLYAVLAFPAAAWLDRRSRKWAVVAGVILWSSLTIVSGFAQDFTTLQICRAGVALGEAVLTPAALSLIADSFPAERRALPTAVYVSVASIMGTGTYMVGAAALSAAEVYSAQLGMEPWRLTLVIVGAPGLIVGALFALTTKEPSRKTLSAGPSAKSDIGPILRAHGTFIAVYFIAVGVMVAAGISAIIWVPTILVREFGFELARAGSLYGLVALPAAVGAAYGWAWISQVLERRGKRDAAVLLVSLGALVSLPFAIAGPFVDNATLFLLFAAIAPLGVGAVPPMAALVVQAIGTSSSRATLTAIYLLATSIIGLGGGSVAVPLLAEWQGNETRPLSAALASFSLVAYLVASFALMTMRGRYRRIRESA